MATAITFPAGVPVLTGTNTVSHSRGFTRATGQGHLVSPSRFRDGFYFMDMPRDSVVRLEGPALPPALLKERTRRAVVGR